MKALFPLMLVMVGLMACSPTGESDPMVGLDEKVTESFKNGQPKVTKYYKQGTLDLAKQVFYYENGNIQQEGSFDEGERDGSWKSYYANGQEWSLNTYSKGILEGPYRTWYQNGQLRIEGAYSKGEPSGHWKFYDEEGNLVKEQQK